MTFDELEGLADWARNNPLPSAEQARDLARRSHDALLKNRMLQLYIRHINAGGTNSAGEKPPEDEVRVVKLRRPTVRKPAHGEPQSVEAIE